MGLGKKGLDVIRWNPKEQEAQDHLPAEINGVWVLWRIWYLWECSAAWGTQHPITLLRHQQHDRPRVRDLQDPGSAPNGLDDLPRVGQSLPQSVPCSTKLARSLSRHDTARDSEMAPRWRRVLRSLRMHLSDEHSPGGYARHQDPRPNLLYREQAGLRGRGQDWVPHQLHRDGQWLGNEVVRHVHPTPWYLQSCLVVRVQPVRDQPHINPQP